jgi:serine/threonine protein kinase/tetratricopeptide (TPR) repeat protein
MREIVGPYRIDRKLGEGGMGVVYAAHDQRLDRPVALKMLRAAPDDAQARERLRREARAAASVNHPNVCQVYDIGEDGGEMFVAMELLEGEPLSALLTRGALELDQTTGIAYAVLLALDALHQRGVVHRDLKPSNIFLTPHAVKLLDFGLARPMPAAMADTRTNLTVPGAILGTPSYMAPEQVRGETVDVRADLFTAGVVIFEMIAGRLPFAGRSFIDVFHAITSQPAPSIDGPGRVFNPLLDRALAKVPADRFPSARAMSEALLAASPMGGATTIISGNAGIPASLTPSGITGTSAFRSAGPSWRGSGSAPAVKPPPTRLIALPFKMLRPDPEIDFLGHSLADAISTSLSGVGSLVVRSTLTAAKFAADAGDVEKIGQQAGVDVVLTGTLLRAGSQLRVTAQLVEVEGGTLLWSETSQVTLGDIFQLQDDLTQRIVTSLKLPLTAREHRLLNLNVPASARAYEWYLRASQLSLEATTWNAALVLYERCVAEDPQYAPAWARLGRMYRLMAKYGEDSSAADVGRAEAAFLRALELNPDLPLAHTNYAALEVDMARGRDAMVRLLRLARTRESDADLFNGLVLTCRYNGLLDASLAAHHRARLLDPSMRTSVVHTYIMGGQYRRALEEVDQALDPMRGVILTMLDRNEEAIEQLEKDEARFAHRVMRLFVAAIRFQLSGRGDEALAAVQEILQSNFRDPEGVFYLTLLLPRLGQVDLAEMLLGKAVEGGFHCTAPLRHMPWLEPLRARPSFQALLARAEERQRENAEAFIAEGGPQILGLRADGAASGSGERSGFR